MSRVSGLNCWVAWLRAMQLDLRACALWLRASCQPATKPTKLLARAAVKPITAQCIVHTPAGGPARDAAAACA